MKIASLTLEGSIDRKTGQPVAYATIKRPAGSDFIEVVVDWPDGQSVTHKVAAADREDLWSIAEGLQQMLDGCRGTNSMVDDYFRELERFA